MRRLPSALTTLAACLLLGACATQTGGYGSMRAPAAMTAADQSLPDVADDQTMYLQLIQKMQGRGLYYASLAHIDAYARRYGTPPALQILRADALRKTQDPARAGAIYKTLLDGPQAAAAWHGLGLMAAAQGHYGKAAGDLAHAVELAPINAAYLGDLGYARLRAGNPQGAREPLAKAAELAPSDVKAIANLALLMMVEGHDAKARAMMDKADLPQDTRRAVASLAAQLRRTSTTATTPTHAAFTSTTPAGNDDVSRTYGISSNILDRFHQTPAAGGHRHEQP